MTDRELLDDNYEPIIAHEAAHHWFGNLVTCESWANIALNEAFATYSEVLWEKHKYGNDAAHYMTMDYLDVYMRRADDNPKKIIRYTYEHPDDLFDSHSYEKGGHVLYMLHNYLGDEAFFEAIKLYLTRHAYQSVEIHNLRMAFEEVSGEDLNWFFDQWFFKAGYPELEVSYSINEITATVDIKQTQSNGVTYRLPLAIDIYTETGIEREMIVLDKKNASFSFDTEGLARFVNVDADNILLGKISESRDIDSYVTEFYNAPHFQDRYSSFKYLSENLRDIEQKEEIVKAGMKDKFWVIRELAIEAIDAEDENIDGYIPLLKTVAISDTKTAVSAAAIEKLSELEVVDFDEELIELCASPSYLVASSALKALSKVDTEKALTLAEQNESENNNMMKLSILNVYAYNADQKKNNYFIEAIDESSSYMRYPALYYYSYFLVRQSDDSLINKGIDRIAEQAKDDDSPMWLRKRTVNIISDMLPVFQERIDRERDEMKPEELLSVKAYIKETIESLEEEFPELKIITQPSTP